MMQVVGHPDTQLCEVQASTTGRWQSLPRGCCCVLSAKLVRIKASGENRGAPH